LLANQMEAKYTRRFFLAIGLDVVLPVQIACSKIDEFSSW